jgi:hypothetical protein
LTSIFQGPKIYDCQEFKLGIDCPENESFSNPSDHNIVSQQSSDKIHADKGTYIAAAQSSTLFVILIE